MPFHAAINIQNLTAIFLHFITVINTGKCGRVSGSICPHHAPHVLYPYGRERNGRKGITVPHGPRQYQHHDAGI